MKPTRKTLRHLACVTILFALIIAVGYVYYGSGKSELIREEHEKLYALADLKTSQLHDWIDERKGDAAFFLNSIPVARTLSGYLKRRSAEDKKSTLQFLEALKKKNSYMAVFLIDDEGRTVLSTDREETLSANDIATLQQSMAAREIRIADIEKVGPEKAHLDIFAPLMNDTAKPSHGALVLRIDPETYLYPSLRNWPTPSPSAETLLVRREGNDVLFLNKLRHKKDAALSFRIPLGKTNLPASIVVRGIEDTVEGYDYRGTKVLFAGKSVPGTPWFLVAKVDAAEVYTPLHNRAIISALLSLLLFTAFIMLLGVIWRQREAEFLRIELREQTRAAVKIAEREENLAVTLASIGDAVIVTDMEGRVTQMNAVAEKLTGWPLAEAAGWPLDEIFVIINEETRRPVDNPVQKVLETGGIIGLSNHTALIARDGSELPIADRGAPIKDRDGNILGVVLVFNDQKEERSREWEIINSRDLYLTLFDAVPDMLLVLDRECRVIHSNWHGILHDVPQADRERSAYCHELLKKGPGAFCDSCQTRQVLDSGRSCITEMTLPGHGQFEVHSCPIFDDSGSVTMVVRYFRDITEHNKLEEQLRHSQKMEAIGTLAGGIAHDFNNLLTVIMGYANIAAMKLAKDDPLRNNLAKVLTAADSAAALTKGLLAYSRKEAINLHPVDLNDIVKKVDLLLSRIIGEDIGLMVMPTNSKLFVMADDGQIEQILMNLASNASGAMQGGGKLRIGITETNIDAGFIAIHGYGKEGDYALISVSDNGTGMDEATRERIFEPFYTTKEVGKGTGLGLAIVYGIVKQHNGFINVYSEPGMGTTFRVYLPLTNLTPSNRHGSKALPVRGNGESILLVEDSAEIRTVLGTMMTDFGYRVIYAADGEKGVEKFIRHQDEIDLLLLDVIMPRKNGRETFDAIRAIKPDVKALFMSGYAADIVSCKGIDTEGFELLTKPFPPLSLLAKVRDVLDRPSVEIS
jgi:PAS domain S-box-containing protein